MSDLQEDGLRLSDEIHVLHFLPDGHCGLSAVYPVGTDDASLFLLVSLLSRGDQYSPRETGCVCSGLSSTCKTLLGLG